MQPIESQLLQSQMLIEWLKVLNDGYVKPHMKSDNDTCCNETGVVRETKKFFQYIEGANKTLSQILNAPPVAGANN